MSLRRGGKRKMEIVPEHICSDVLFSPVLMHPLTARLRNLARHVLMRTFPAHIARKEHKRVAQIAVVELHGHVVHPRLRALEPPLGVQARLEHERVRAHEPAEARAPPVPVDVEQVLVLPRRGRGDVRAELERRADLRAHVRLARLGLLDERDVHERGVELAPRELRGGAHGRAGRGGRAQHGHARERVEGQPVARRLELGRARARGVDEAEALALPPVEAGAVPEPGEGAAPEEAVVVLVRPDGVVVHARRGLRHARRVDVAVQGGDAVAELRAGEARGDGVDVRAEELPVQEQVLRVLARVHREAVVVDECLLRLRRRRVADLDRVRVRGEGRVGRAHCAPAALHGGQVLGADVRALFGGGAGGVAPGPVGHDVRVVVRGEDGAEGRDVLVHLGERVELRLRAVRHEVLHALGLRERDVHDGDHVLRLRLADGERVLVALPLALHFL